MKTLKIIEEATAEFKRLLGEHWDQLASIAELDEKETAKASFSLVVAFGGKVPRGSLKMSFGVKTTDEGLFGGDDPDQAKLAV